MNTPTPVSALYLVGPPGVGKTTLARELIRRLDPGWTAYLVPSPKWTIIPGVLAAAGHYGGHVYDGADRVPYDGVEAALAHWAGLELPLAMFDGDRFSHAKALGTVGRRARVTVAHLTAPEEVLVERRRLRGSRQDPAWTRGRATKAAGFVDLARDAGFGVLELNAADEVALQVEKVFSAWQGGPEK